MVKLKKVEKYLIKGKREKALLLMQNININCEDGKLFSFVGDIYFSINDYSQAKNYYSKSYQISNFKYFNRISLSQFLHSLYKLGEYELFNQLIDLGQHPKEKSDTITILEKIGHFTDEENSSNSQ